jgi:hypothetical protein
MRMGLGQEEVGMVELVLKVELRFELAAVVVVVVVVLWAMVKVGGDGREPGRMAVVEEASECEVGPVMFGTDSPTALAAGALAGPGSALEFVWNRS